VRWRASSAAAPALSALEVGARLRDQHQMGAHMAHLIQPRTGQRHQRDPHPDKGLVDDVQPAFGQQAMDVGHAPIGRVLDRQHGQFGLAVAHRVDHLLEGAAGQRFHLGAGLHTGLMRVGARFALKGDASGHVSPRLRSFGRANIA
jgi:hypothetical protein